MDYKIDNNYHLRNIIEEIEKRLKEEGKVYYLPVEESQAINNNLKEGSIKAKREQIRNQVSSRIKSLEIIFNA